MFIYIDTTRKLKYNAYIRNKKVGEIMSVGSRIKELRENKGLSRNELANLLGVTVGAISNYENEVSSPKEPILFKIMDVLKCDANYLFQDALDMPAMKNSVSVDEFEHIKKYRDLDDHGRDMVDTVMEKEYDRCHPAHTKMASFSHPVTKAAHARTDIERTPEGKAHDDALMENDEYWK